jgi:RNAse (barnase) inhibitor barstar
MPDRLSFRLPEASIPVEANEAERLFVELDRLGSRLTGQDYARLARRVGTALNERSVRVIELLDVAENEKVLRALEHLAARDELSADLVSLWEGLTRDLRPVAVPYRLELVHLDGRKESREMTSLSGSYSVGDVIPAPAGECWQVVDARSEESGPTRLVCDPCQ